jgi:hypothetical protein
MKDHEHATKDKPETKPAQDEVATKAYAIYLKEGRPVEEIETRRQNTDDGARNRIHLHLRPIMSSLPPNQRCQSR